MFNEGNNLFGKAGKVLSEPAAKGSVLLCPDGDIHFNAYDDERLNVFLYNELPGEGGDPAEIEEFLSILAIDNRIAEYFIIAWGEDKYGACVLPADARSKGFV